jgi:hypothetical protein
MKLFFEIADGIATVTFNRPHKRVRSRTVTFVEWSARIRE